MNTSQTNPSRISRKRIRSSLWSYGDNNSSDSDSDPEEIEIVCREEAKKNDPWPKFIVLESKDDKRPLNKVSPFLISKAIEGMVGTTQQIRKLRSGALLVETKRKQQSVTLMMSKHLANIPIEASAHRTLNTCKGVIRDKQQDMKYMTEEEITKELSDQGVKEVSRFMLRKDGKQIATNTYFVSFAAPRPPRDVTIGYYKIKVEPYIPNPLRCFKCQQYGHGQGTCKKDITCWRCGAVGHDGMDCKNPAHCCNCQGDHVASSKECPIWKYEKQIQIIKYEKNIGYYEAKQLAGSSPLQKTYASVAKVNTRSTECQTELTWLKGAKPSLTPKNKTTDQKKSQSVQTSVAEKQTKKTMIPSTDQRKTSEKSSNSQKNAQKTTEKFSNVKEKDEKNSSEISTQNRYHPLGDGEEDMETQSPPKHRSRSRSKQNGGKPPKSPIKAPS